MFIARRKLGAKTTLLGFVKFTVSVIPNCSSTMCRAYNVLRIKFYFPTNHV